MHPYGEKYGFDLEQSLARHTIREMEDPTKKGYLIESLERGNRQSVTMVLGGEDKKMMIEASPRFKSLNVYEMNGIRVKAEQLYAGKSQGETIKQGAGQATQQSAGQDRKIGEGQSESKAEGKSSKASTKQGADADEREAGEKKNKRRKQSVH